MIKILPLVVSLVLGSGVIFISKAPANNPNIKGLNDAQSQSVITGHINVDSDLYVGPKIIIDPNISASGKVDSNDRTQFN